MGQAEIMKILKKYKSLTVKEITKRCEAGRSSVTNALRKMWINKELERETIREGQIYRIRYWIKDKIT